MDIEEAKNKKAKAEMEIAHILEKLEAETGLKVSNMFYICREKDKSALAVSPHRAYKNQHNLNVVTMEIKNVGQLRKIIENLSDDYEIEMRVRRKLTDEELKNCRYPYPYDTEYLILEFDDIGVSDKVLCLGVTSNR